MSIMATPNSAASSYATPSDMLDHYDIRTVADLINDTSVRTGGSPNPVPATVEADPKLVKALNAAAGIIEAATLRSKRYFVADLQALDGCSKEFLIQINCDLAMGLLYRRRPDKGQIPPFFTAAMAWLDQLANGERVFSFEENEDAGLPRAYVETAADVEERAMVAQQACRYFGITADELNPYNGGISGTGNCGSC